MNQETDARQMAMDQEEAARMTAGVRQSAMGRAALCAMRREASAMAGMRVGPSRTGLIPAKTGGTGSATTGGTAVCRAALNQVMRKWAEPEEAR